MSAERVFEAAALTRAIVAVLAAAGSAQGEADHVARSLVEANLRGHDSHGIGMIPRYVGAVLDGGLRPNQSLTRTFDVITMLGFDGNRGYGQVLGDAAMQAAIGRARELGTCVLSLANTHHLGRIGQYAELAIAAGFVSINFVNVLSMPVVAPWGGSDARYGTNPVCIGVPLPGREPFVFDAATTAVAQGKLRVAHNRREEVKPGLVLDDRGWPSTDPRYAVVQPRGAMMPFGEHKGFGLAVACELLAGALTASGAENGRSRGDSRVTNGMLSIVIDPARMGERDAFAEQVRGYLEWMQGSPVREGFDRVRIAGDPEREARAQRLAHGIPVDPTTWDEIGAAAEKAGLGRSALESLATRSEA
jgi:uncharacterized oxidoreductase